MGYVHVKTPIYHLQLFASVLFCLPTFSKSFPCYLKSILLVEMTNSHLYLKGTVQQFDHYQIKKIIVSYSILCTFYKVIALDVTHLQVHTILLIFSLSLSNIQTVNKTYVYTKTCTGIFIAVLFLILKNWKQSKCSPSTCERIISVTSIQ